MGSAKMWFEFIPSFVRFIFAITFPKEFILSSSFIDNVISQVDILLISVGTEICCRDIYQYLNVYENSIDWCVHIKSNLFCHILTSGKHLRCDFSTSAEEMLNDDVNGIIDGVSVTILQGSDVLCDDSYDGFLW